MEFTKSDFWKAVIAGEGIALLALPVFKNLNILDFTFLFIALWLFLLPVITVMSLHIIYVITIGKGSTFFQIGKYGIVGWLNVFLAIGIFNLLIWHFSIAEGFWVDGFAGLAFFLTTVNSFYWNKLWTFNSSQSLGTKKEYIRFFAVTAFVSIFSIFLIHLVVNIIGTPSTWKPVVWSNIAIAITIPISFLGNFFGYKIFVFHV